jgi:hypothetical protein
LIALLLILVAHSSYCQYPITKIIGQDTVVIMTLKQGEEINNLYKDYNKQIVLLKDTLKTKKHDYDSLYKTISAKTDSFYNWKYRYSTNKTLYEARETDQEKINKINSLSKVMLMLIIILQFSQLH